MNILCLSKPAWRTGAESPVDLLPLLLQEVPRVAMESRGVVWADGRGLPAEKVANRLLARLLEVNNEGVRIGIGTVPIVAEAASWFGPTPLYAVATGAESEFLTGLPLSILTSDERMLDLLEGSGLRTCGDLAALTAESVEVRFGNEGARVWSLARGEDPRLLFRPIPRERPCATVDFVDYTVQDATRLVFTLNALLDQISATLRTRALRARAIALTFSLAGGGSVQEVLRTARPTADRTLWLRRLRAMLDRIELPDSVNAVSLEVLSTDPLSALQGDLFDRGFATASVVEEAVARLLDLYRGLFVRQVETPHPLAERRVRWIDLTPEEIAGTGGGQDSAPPSLALHLLTEPRRIQVRCRVRRDHNLPVRYRDGTEWRELTVAGPDRISGGHEEERSYAREYYRCVSSAGDLIWIYRDAVEDRWYLHGWWD